MSIGTKIQELRQKQKLTQKELGDLLNVSDKTVSRWETDKCLPDVTMMASIANALGVTVAELYDCVGEETRTQEKDYERVWRYKKCSIIAYILLFVAPLALLLSPEYIFDKYIVGLQWALLAISIAALVASLSIELIEFVSLFSYAREKANSKDYDRTLIAFGVSYIVLFIVSMTACMLLLFLPFGILG